MSEEITKLEHTGFKSKTCGSTPPPYLQRRLQKQSQPQKKRPSQAAVYLAVRLGVCLLLFGAVLAAKLSNSPKSAQVLSLLNDTQTELGEGEQRLGRLRFVEIPSIIDVFAPSSEPMLPAEAHGYSLLEDDTLLMLDVNAGSNVNSPCSGIVQSVGTDERLGVFVAVLGSNDTEYRIFGLAEAAVEKGQPLTQTGILGTAAGSSLYVRVYKSGSPENPAEYFSLGRLK